MTKSAPRSKEKSANQKKRTAKNQVEKYQKMLDLDPKNKQAKVWQTKVDFYSKQ